MSFLQNIFQSKKTDESLLNPNPTFIGTEEDFNRFMSSFFRNLVQKITKKHKSEIGKCEHCGKNGVQLDAAHVNGHERKNIIASIVKDYTYGELYKIDLIDFEEKFVQYHDQIENVIKILYKECHKTYDTPNYNNATISSKEIFAPTKQKTFIMNKKLFMLTKDSAINIINQKLNLRLNNLNTNWSNINANGIWSIEPNIERKKCDLFLILNNNNSKKMHVFKIPANHNIYEKLYVRPDVPRFRLLFNLNDEVFIETLKYINFKNYYIATIDYENGTN